MAKLLMSCRFSVEQKANFFEPEIRRNKILQILFLPAENTQPLNYENRPVNAVSSRSA